MEAVLIAIVAIVAVFFILIALIALAIAIWEYATASPPTLANLTPATATLCDNDTCEILLSYRLENVNELTLTIQQHDIANAFEHSLWRLPNPSSVLPLTEYTSVNGNNISHRLRYDAADVFPSGHVEYRLHFKLRRKLSLGNKDSSVSTFVKLLPSGAHDTVVLGAHQNVPLVDADQSDPSDSGVGLSEVVAERELFGSLASGPAGHMVCAGSRLTGLSITACGVAFASKDPNFQTAFPSVDLDRVHPEEVHLVVMRGDTLLLDLGTMQAGQEQTFDFPILIEGEQPLRLRGAMLAGPEGNFQYSFEVGFRSEWWIDCPA